MAKYTNDELLEAFGEMTLVELSEFVKAFEEKFDVEAAAPAAVAVAAPGAAAPAEEEKDEFDVILSAVGDKKIQVIKAVRAITSWVWPRPRLWSTALRRPFWRRPRRKTPRRPSPSSKKPALPSSSSDSRGLKPQSPRLEKTPFAVWQSGFSAICATLAIVGMRRIVRGGCSPVGETQGRQRVGEYGVAA